MVQKICDNASSEEQIAEKPPSIIGDIAQVMFSVVCQNIATNYSDAYYSYAITSNYVDIILYIYLLYA